MEMTMTVNVVELELQIWKVSRMLHVKDFVRD